MTLAYMSKERKKTTGGKKQSIRAVISNPVEKAASEVSLADVLHTDTLHTDTLHTDTPYTDTPYTDTPYTDTPYTDADVVQRLIDPSAIPSWSSISQESINRFASCHNQPEFLPESPISGSSRGGRVFLTSISSGSSPCYLLDMSDWMNYLTQDERSVNLLEDPNRSGYTLTRMHIINGRFFGPSEPYNMVLGTQEDNARHLNFAERYIYRFFEAFFQNVAGVAEGDRPYGVLYQVIPTTFHVPRYITSIFPAVRSIDFIDFMTWIADACPQNLHCMAQFYIVDKDGRFWYSPEQYESVPIN